MTAPGKRLGLETTATYSNTGKQGFFNLGAMNWDKYPSSHKEIYTLGKFILNQKMVTTLEDVYVLPLCFVYGECSCSDLPLLFHLSRRGSKLDRKIQPSEQGSPSLGDKKTERNPSTVVSHFIQIRQAHLTHSIASSPPHTQSTHCYIRRTAMKSLYYLAISPSSSKHVPLFNNM